MKNHFKRGAAALLAMLVVLSMVTGGGMAAVSYDDETTNTTTTSDLQDGDSIADFNASSDINQFIEIQSDSDNVKLEVVDNESGDVIETFTPSHSSFETTDDSNGHYAWNLSNEALFGDVPIDANSNATVDLVAYENTSADDPNTETAQVTLEGTNERTVVHAGDSFTSDSDTFESLTENRVAGFSVPLDLFGSEASIADIEQDGVAVDGDNTTVTYVLANDSVVDPFDTSADEADAGERMESQLWINGNAHALYNGEAPDDVEDGATYGVYDDGEVEIHVGDDYSDADSLDVHMMGNQEYGLLTQLTSFGPLSGFSIPSLGSGMVTLSAIAPLSIKRRELDGLEA